MKKINKLKRIEKYKKNIENKRSTIASLNMVIMRHLENKCECGDMQECKDRIGETRSYISTDKKEIRKTENKIFNLAMLLYLMGEKEGSE